MISIYKPTTKIQYSMLGSSMQFLMTLFTILPSIVALRPAVDAVTCHTRIYISIVGHGIRTNGKEMGRVWI